MTDTSTSGQSFNEMYLQQELDLVRAGRKRDVTMLTFITCLLLSTSLFLEWKAESSKSDLNMCMSIADNYKKAAERVTTIRCDDDLVMQMGNYIRMRDTTTGESLIMER